MNTTIQRIVKLQTYTLLSAVNNICKHGNEESRVLRRHGDYTGIVTSNKDIVTLNVTSLDVRLKDASHVTGFYRSRLPI